MTASLPKTWILASPHSGDNTQLLALAENLNWPFEVKYLSYQPWHGFTRIMSRATVFGLTQQARAALMAPFPDLIIGAGQPTEAAAFWIKQQASKTVKLVYLGTPLTRLDKFNLVITTPQYGLPHLPNVLQLDLPMHKVEPEKLQAAAARWHEKFKHLPRPWTAILVGGASGPYTFGVAAAQRLANEAQKFGGSLLVTTSARTSVSTATALAGALSHPHFFYSWAADKTSNPFMAMLALADQFIVTADSISMLSEACATGKPVMMFDTETARLAMRDGPMKIFWRGHSVYATLFRLAIRYAPKRWTRDLRIVHRQLINSGLANWLGEKPLAQTPHKPTTALQQATARVYALFEI